MLVGHHLGTDCSHGSPRTAASSPSPWGNRESLPHLGLGGAVGVSFKGLGAPV